MFKIKKQAVLVLEDGTTFSGISVGVKGIVVGEVVFNTAMTGYQEIITDPSYASQIIAFTYPHIGNTGVNGYDNESDNVWAAGIIMRDFDDNGSNYRTEKSLQVFLYEKNIIAMAGVDTRSLTRYIRKKGCLKGCIMCEDIDLNKALHLAQSWQPESSSDIIQRVTSKNIRKYAKGRSPRYLFEYANFVKSKEIESFKKENVKYKVIVYDFGVKTSILNNLVDKGLDVIVVPSHTTIEKIKNYSPDGIVFSNGPGDPRECQDLISTVANLLLTGIPVLGICLGHQLLSLAYGAKVFKMQFGHHGANHPVYNLKNKMVSISSQNHNFAVLNKELPEGVNVIAVSLFDQTIQALENTYFNAISFQGHPEAGPGPRDCYYIFDFFLEQIIKYNLCREKTI
jgi:carbamoyl-phosphate synthase small subunit